jgi:hypothetical protein
VDGLHVDIDACSIPWAEVLTAGVYTYSCLGSTTSVLASRPIAMTAVGLSNVALAAGGGTTYLRVRTELPSTADNTFQGLSSEFSFMFAGVQRSATSR